MFWSCRCTSNAAQRELAEDKSRVVTLQRGRAAPFERKPFVHGSSKWRSCKGELADADCFTLEEFGVGSEAEGF